MLSVTGPKAAAAPHAPMSLPQRPSASRTSAIAFLLLLLLCAHLSAQTSLTAPWTQLGPIAVTSPAYNALTGRVTALALDPNDPTGNTLYLGATGAGVWKSTNAAGPLASVTFRPLTDTLPAFSPSSSSYIPPALSIGAIAVQPAANPVIIAGTGDPKQRHRRVLRRRPPALH